MKQLEDAGMYTKRAVKTMLESRGGSGGHKQEGDPSDLDNEDALLLDEITRYHGPSRTNRMQRTLRESTSGSKSVPASPTATRKQYYVQDPANDPFKNVKFVDISSSVSSTVNGENSTSNPYGHIRGGRAVGDVNGVAP